MWGRDPVLLNLHFGGQFTPEFWPILYKTLHRRAFVPANLSVRALNLQVGRPANSRRSAPHWLIATPARIIAIARNSRGGTASDNSTAPRMTDHTGTM